MADAPPPVAPVADAAAAPPAPAAGAAAAANLDSAEIWGDTSGIEAELASLTPEEIRQRTSMLNNNMRVLRSDLNSVDTEIKCVRGGRL